MKIEVGDIIRLSYRVSSFFGHVIEIDQRSDKSFVTIWRPELQGFHTSIQTYPLDSDYRIEVINESR